MGCNKSKAAAVVESQVASPVHEERPRPSENEPALDQNVVWGGGKTILAHRGSSSTRATRWRIREAR